METKSHSRRNGVKALLIVASILIVLLTIYSSYIFTATKAREKQLAEYLEDKGYAVSDIQRMGVHYVWGSWFLGSINWKASVSFKDEPFMVYYYYFVNSEIIQNGFRFEYDLVYAKEPYDARLREYFKHLEKPY